VPYDLVSRRESPLHGIATPTIVAKYDHHSGGYDLRTPARRASDLGNWVARHGGQPFDEP